MEINGPMDFREVSFIEMQSQKVSYSLDSYQAEADLQNQA